MIEKVVRIVSKQDKKSDFAFWQTQPYEARLEVLEKIRIEYHNGHRQGFQRVYKIIKRS